MFEDFIPAVGPTLPKPFQKGPILDPGVHLL
jgi:hypothetical protein